MLSVWRHGLKVTADNYCEAQNSLVFCFYLDSFIGFGNIAIWMNESAHSNHNNIMNIIKFFCKYYNRRELFTRKPPLTSLLIAPNEENSSGASASEGEESSKCASSFRKWIFWTPKALPEVVWAKQIAQDWRRNFSKGYNFLPIRFSGLWIHFRTNREQTIR